MSIFKKAEPLLTRKGALPKIDPSINIAQEVYRGWTVRYEALRKIALGVDTKWVEISPLLLNKPKLKSEEITYLDAESRPLKKKMEAYCAAADVLLREPGPPENIVLLNEKRQEYVRKLRNVFGVRV